MRNVFKLSLAAFLPLTACAVAGSDSALDQDEPGAASLGVTVSNLTLSSAAVASDEWCVFGIAAFNAANPGVNLTEGRQVRIWRSGAGNLGACTVRNDATLAANQVRMNADGFRRIEGDASQTYTVSIDTVVATTQYPYSASSPPQASATSDQEFFEWRRNAQTAIPSTAQIVAIAPHGGGIEQATAAQARVDFYGAIPSGRVVDWEAYGYNSTNGTTDTNNGFDHWHITSTEIAPESFPILNSLVTRGFPYAISFHGFGQADFSSWGKHVFVGGGESALFRREITDVLNTLSGTITGFNAIYRNIPGGLDGDDATNIVNRFNAAHRGIQLEQAWDLRGVSGSSNHSATIAQRVATVYACLTDSAVTLAQNACTASASVSGAASSTPCGRFVADTTIPSSYGAGFTVRGSLDVAALTQSQCSTVQGYVSIYRMEGGRFERKAGGTIAGVWNNNQCTTAVQAGDDASINAFITDSFTGSPPASGQDQYRITVSGKYGSGSGTALTGVASLTRNGAPATGCCTTDTQCAVAADTCSCTCVGIPAGGSAPVCKDPMSCIVDPCRWSTPVCSGGFCAASNGAAY